jgi:hypothetical protein
VLNFFKLGNGSDIDLFLPFRLRISKSRIWYEEQLSLDIPFVAH